MAAIKESLIELRKAMLNADIQRRFDMRVLGLTDEQITAYDANQGSKILLGRPASGSGFLTRATGG